MMEEEFKRAIQRGKRQYGQVYVATIQDELFVFRALTYQELQEVLLFQEDEQQGMEMVCKITVLYPTHYDFLTAKAGIVEQLGDEILRVSAFFNQEQISAYFFNAQMRMESFHEQAISTIAAVFSQYSFEQLEQMSVERLMTLLARAEWVLRNIHQRNIEFRKREEASPSNSPSKKQQAEELRQHGLDPILISGPPHKSSYVEFPFIGGIKVWKHEELYQLVGSQVRESLSRLSGRPDILPTISKES